MSKPVVQQNWVMEAVREGIGRVQASFEGPDGRQDNGTLIRAAAIGGLTGSVLLTFILIATGREPATPAGVVEDPKALRPVKVVSEPAEPAASEHVSGGMSGAASYGGRLLVKRPCTRATIPLKDAVRRSSGLRLVTGAVGETPCAEAAPSR